MIVNEELDCFPLVEITHTGSDGVETGFPSGRDAAMPDYYLVLVIGSIPTGLAIVTALDGADGRET